MKAELSATLAGLGIPSGAAVMVHSDAMAVAQFPGMGSLAGMQLFWQTFQELLGDPGTLLVPVFTYSLTRQETYDPLVTPSQVGLMTEAFRQMAGVQRTLDPVFSMAIRGNHAQQIVSRSCTDCFGEASAFAWLAENSGWIAGFGCHPDRITFTHYVEQLLQVDYRYLKRFNGEMRLDGQVMPCHCDYFVRDLTRQTEIDLSRLVSRLKATGRWHQCLFGRIPAWAVRCQDFIDEMRELLSVQPDGVIKEGRQQ